MTLEEIIVAIVDARIAAVLGTRAIYSTEDPSLYPPGRRSRRACRDAIRAVPGHEHIGRGRASIYRVDRERYHAHHGRTSPALHIVPSSPMTDEEIAAAALEATSTRPTRRSA